LRVTEELPTIDDILKLHKNLQTMRVLCNHFLPCVVGKKRWKMQILAGKHVNDIATVSDEAFVLLVLENIWVDMMKISVDEYYRPKKRKNKPDHEDNEGAKDRDAHTMATNDDNDQQGNKVITGRWTSAWRGSRRYGGWSPEGLNHFNKLVKMVKQDQENDTHFQAQYEIWLNETKSKNKKQKAAEPVVRAYRDLTSLGV